MISLHKFTIFSYTTIFRFDSSHTAPCAKYCGGDLKEITEHPFPWQQQFLDSVSVWDTNKGTDDRQISVIVNKLGNIGKSKLLKYLAFKGLACCVPAGTATQIKMYIINSPTCKIYVVDLPRQSGKDEKFGDVMSALEDVKNGNMTCPMYGGNNRKLMLPPHVWIFTNAFPPFWMASADRWNVYSIESKQARLKRMTTAEYKAAYTEQCAEKASWHHVNKINYASERVAAKAAVEGAAEDAGPLDADDLEHPGDSGTEEDVDGEDDDEEDDDEEEEDSGPMEDDASRDDSDDDEAARVAQDDSDFA
jgi:hypothetical protein